MPNQLSSELEAIEILRSRSTAPPASLIAQIAQTPKRPVSWKFLITGISVAGAGTLVVSMAFAPRISLGNVVKAQSLVKQFSLVNTRLLGGNKIMVVETYSDGNRWSSTSRNENGTYSRIVMDGSKTYRINHFPTFIDTLEIDEATPMPRWMFSIDALLRKGNKASIQYGLTWHGQKVDRFTSQSTYRDRGKTQTLDQEILADSKSHLPLVMKIMRDKGSWGDTWEYNYGPVSADRFAVNAPKTAQLVDLIAERNALRSRLAAKPIVLVDRYTIALLVPSGLAKTFKGAQVRVNGSKYWRLPNSRGLSIDGHSWDFINLEGNLDCLKLMMLKTTEVAIGPKTLQGIAICPSGDVRQLVTPFKIPK